MTVKQAAEQLEISASLVYLLIAEGKLRATRHGIGRGTIRISEEQLAEYKGRAEETDRQPLKFIR